MDGLDGQSYRQSYSLRQIDRRIYVHGLIGYIDEEGRLIDIDEQIYRWMNPKLDEYSEYIFSYLCFGLY